MKNIEKAPLNAFVHHEQTGALWQLSDLFLNHIPFDHEELIFCCIGTDRSTGDALGPLAGSFLASFHSFPFEIIGTLENPLHAVNLASTIEKINEKPKAPYIVAIDACLGSERNIGHIVLQDGPLFPGKAVKKELPPIGDISIKGIVNVGGFMEMLVLQNTRLNVTYSMGHKIARALLLAYQRYSLKKKHDGNNDSDYNNPGQQISYPDFRQPGNI